jgi:signal transduction histidine kinase
VTGGRGAGCGSDRPRTTLIGIVDTTSMDDAMHGTAYDLEVNDTLRRLVVIFRVLAWIWMAILVVLTLTSDDGVNAPVAVGALTGAASWVLVTWWAARSGALGEAWFVTVDGTVALVIGYASTLAGAQDLFHGGMPMSWILVAAYGYGLRGALPASLVLSAEQAIVHVVDGRGPVGAAGSIVFIVFAVVVGWGFDELRAAVVRRLRAEERLRDEQRTRARHVERLRLADQLHDSVLQSLLVMRRDADDPQQVRYLARREERRLRRAIADLRSEHDESFRAALLAVCDDVEDTYRIEVDSIIRDDVPIRGAVEAALLAAREALVNAAKHAGVGHVDLYSDATSDHLTVNILDRGTGFDDERRKHGGGLDHSLIDRIRASGGSVAIVSTPGEGTEVSMTVSLGR